MSDESSDKHSSANAGSVQKPFYKNWLTWVGIVLSILILVYASGTDRGLGTCPNQSEGGWVKQTVPISLFMMSSGTLIAIAAGYYARKAWAKSADEYLDWLRQIKKSAVAYFWLSFMPRSFPVWHDRILLIPTVAIGVFMALIGAYSLWRNIFCG